MFLPATAINFLALFNLIHGRNLGAIQVNLQIHFPFTLHGFIFRFRTQLGGHPLRRGERKSTNGLANQGGCEGVLHGRICLGSKLYGVANGLCGTSENRRGWQLMRFNCRIFGDVVWWRWPRDDTNSWWLFICFRKAAVVLGFLVQRWDWRTKIVRDWFKREWLSQQATMRKIRHRHWKNTMQMTHKDDSIPILAKMTDSMNWLGRQIRFSWQLSSHQKRAVGLTQRPSCFLYYLIVAFRSAAIKGNSHNQKLEVTN